MPVLLACTINTEAFLKHDSIKGHCIPVQLAGAQERSCAMQTKLCTWSKQLHVAIVVIPVRRIQGWLTKRITHVLLDATYSHNIMLSSKLLRSTCKMHSRS